MAIPRAPHARPVPRPRPWPSPELIVAYQAEAQIAGRPADRAATGPGFADEVGDVGPVPAFDHPHPTVGGYRLGLSRAGEAVAFKAGGGPFPDVAGEIDKPMFVGAKTADRLRGLDAAIGAIGALVIKHEGATAGIGDLGDFRDGIVAKAASRRVGPFPVARQAEAQPRAPRQPGRIGLRVAKAHLDHRAVGAGIAVD